MWFSKKKQAAKTYSDEIQDSIKKKWPDDPIEIEELIYHAYDDDSVDGKPSPEKQNILIFVDRNLDLDWMAVPDVAPERLMLISKAKDLESYPHKHLSRADIIEYKKMVGHAMIAGFLGSEDDVDSQIKRALSFYTKRITEKSRTWTLITLFPIALAILIYIIANGSFADLDVMAPGIYLASILSGVLGATVSLIQRTGAANLDSSSGLLLHILEVFSKLLVGGISGFFAIMIGKSVLSPEIMATLLKNIEGIVALSFVAGFSERFIPQMVSKFELTKGEEK